jgi:hypothetical protein
MKTLLQTEIENLLKSHNQLGAFHPGVTSISASICYTSAGL